MFVFIPGSVPPVRFWPVGTDPPEGSISPITLYTWNKDKFKSAVHEPIMLCLDAKAQYSKILGKTRIKLPHKRTEGKGGEECKPRLLKIVSAKDQNHKRPEWGWVNP